MFVVCLFVCLFVVNSRELGMVVHVEPSESEKVPLNINKYVVGLRFF